MAPPPITPSPHRFLSRSKNPERRPPSSLRLQHPAPSSSQQFALAPKFSAASSSARDGQEVVEPQSSSPLVSRVRRPNLKPKEEQIEESDESGNEAAHSEHAEDKSSPSSDDNDEDDWPRPNPFKRRRLSPCTPQPPRHRAPRRKIDAICISSDEDVENDRQDNNDDDDNEEEFIHQTTHPTISSSPTSPHPPSNPASHFLLTTTTTTHTPTQPPAPRRAFILPDTTADSSAQPLPEAFSPHRRGAKYLPDGLAATVRGWIFETAQYGSQRQRVLRERDDGRGGVEHVTRVEVGERSGGKDGMVLVRGKHSEGVGGVTGEEEGAAGRWILVGQSENEVEVGAVVTVKWPVWDVRVRGEVWNVAVNWSVARH